MGLQDEVLPRKPAAIQDIEVCRLLVGITRTKKRCCMMCTRMFAGKKTQPSTFLSWIDKNRYDRIHVDAEFWKRQSK